MAVHYRQCPNCGGRTIESVCEICGRKTMDTGKRYDGPTANTSPVSVSRMDKQKNSSSKPAGHIQTMLAEGRKYRNKTPKLERKRGNGKFIFLLWIVLIVFSAIFRMALDEDREDYDDYETMFDQIDSQRVYLENYLSPVSTDEELICEIEDDMYVIFNPTPYTYEAEVELTTENGKEYSYVYYGSPYDYDTHYAGSSAQDCRVTDAEFQDLILYDTNIDYRFTYDDYNIRELRIDHSLTSEQLEQLLIRIYCMDLLRYEYFDERMYVIIDDEDAFHVLFDYENGDISIEDVESEEIQHVYVELGW